LSACAEPDPAEYKLPAKTETCGGAALTSRYIVHFQTGKWAYIENSDRENFKENFVRPQVDNIDFIEYDQKIFLEAVTPVAPSRGIDNWGISAIDAPAAWQKSFRGEGVSVAVIDSGVDITHPQLASQIDFNFGESGDKQNNGLDDDGNGLIDDYAGYNFLDNSPDITDDIQHGTHVAGVIAAAHNDSVHKTGYTQGVAPSAKIIPIKFIGENGGSLSSALKGIDYAIQRGAKVINASWGGTGCSQSLRQKVSEASAQNVLFVVAAGNSGNNLDLSPEYPAAFNLPLQITVGAIRSSFNMDSYSNYSRSLVHIFAPGSLIVSTVPGGGYVGLSGTSMATPFVAGASAILLSAKHEMSLSSIRQALFNSAKTDSNYLNLSRGRLHLGQALDAIGL
ncbi:MAG: S8 family serine peptidase, partial [Bdellovibrionales bacterium]|nr:S8 family serine peptidase [Bdellovibrionales bacterium]